MGRFGLLNRSEVTFDNDLQMSERISSVALMESLDCSTRVSCIATERLDAYYLPNVFQ